MEEMNIRDIIIQLQEKVISWFESLVLLLPNLFIALVVILVFSFLARKVAQLVCRILKRMISNQALISFLATLTRIGVLLVGILIAIKILQLDKAIFSLLAGIGIAGIALGFAFQDIAANFIAGMALVFRKDYPFKVNDVIETNDIFGTVHKINLRDTMIRTFGGQYVFLPNKQIFENAVTNYTTLGRRRVDLAVGVSYGEDLEKVKRVSLEVARKIPLVLEDTPVELFYEEFGGSSINFQLRFWIAFTTQRDFLQARSEAVMRIKQAFDDHDITIPFPIRTLDFGIKGGEKLSTMLTGSVRNESSRAANGEK